jgi:hypothetical protein
MFVAKKKNKILSNLFLKCAFLQKNVLSATSSADDTKCGEMSSLQWFAIKNLKKGTSVQYS